MACSWDCSVDLGVLLSEQMNCAMVRHWVQTNNWLILFPSSSWTIQKAAVSRIQNTMVTFAVKQKVDRHANHAFFKSYPAKQWSCSCCGRSCVHSVKDGALSVRGERWRIFRYPF